MSWIKKHLYLLTVLLYLPVLTNFFSSDDWFHLRISQIHSVGEFFNFFSFVHTNQSAAFYRPLPTQVFFFIFQKLFSLNAWPYHLFVLLCFGYSLVLVFRFTMTQLNNQSKATVAAFVYGLSVSNFTRLYFLSAFQEVVLVIFSLQCLLSFPKSKTRSIIFFVLALMSKETAIVLPLLIILFNFKALKKQLLSFLFFFGVIWLGYLFLRLKIFGGAVGESYLWNFSPTKAANTFMWYVLWSFGAPELLVDYVGSGLKLIPRFFVDYYSWWKLIVPFLLGSLISTNILFLQKVKRINGIFILSILFFVVAIWPVLFLPSHKFALELGLPLVGFSIALSWLLPQKVTLVSVGFIFFYLVLNLSMNFLTYTRHYSVSRGEISRRVISYLSHTYPAYPSGKYFEFVNDAENNGSEWGQSKQISQAISGSDLFEVFYQNNNVKVFYQDFSENRPTEQQIIHLSTKQFINP